MADDFGPGGVYTNIPRIDSRGRSQLPMFLRWNSDPVGNDAKNLTSLNPDMQRVIAQARLDNPNLNFVIGSGRRSAADQDQAKTWGWSQVGSKDGGDSAVHMNGNAVDLWGLDNQGRVQFNPDQQKQINQAMQAAAQKLGVGVNWGGNFKNFQDAPHFELAGGGTTALTGPEGPPPLHGSQSPAQLPASPSSSVLDTMRQNIGQYESGNDYNILGKRTNTGDQAVGRYQVMKSNIPSWTAKWLGHTMTPEEFRADPKAQDAVFNGEFGSYLANHSPADASSMWFTGQPLAQGANKRDILGTSGAKYVASTIKGIDNPYALNASATPGTTLTSTPTPPHTLTPPTAGAPYTPAAVAAANPPAAAPAAQPPQNVGDWLRKLGTKPPPTTDAKGNVVQGKSPLEAIAGSFASDKPQAAAEIPAMPQPAPAQDPMMGMAPAAQQLFQSVSAQAAKPLTWSSRPYGSNAGFQGTTLNATGYGDGYG